MILTIMACLLLQAGQATAPATAATQTQAARPISASPDLLKVKRIYVDSFGDDPISKEMQSMIVTALVNSKRFVVTKFGENGSKFQADSIWNKFGTYGSKFSHDSPWNKFSTSAPIIVDKDGGSYGYFSANKFHRDRTKIKWFVRILDFQADHDDLEATRDLMCTE